MYCAYFMCKSFVNVFLLKVIYCLCYGETFGYLLDLLFSIMTKYMLDVLTIFLLIINLCFLSFLSLNYMLLGILLIYYSSIIYQDFKKYVRINSALYFIYLFICLLLFSIGVFLVGYGIVFMFSSGHPGGHGPGPFGPYGPYGPHGPGNNPGPGGPNTHYLMHQTDEQRDWWTIEMDRREAVRATDKLNNSYSFFLKRLVDREARL